MLWANFKTAALAAGVACLAAGTAGADGYAGRAAAPCCAFSWTGFYAGLNGGYAFSNEQSVNGDEAFLGVPGFSGTFGSLEPTGGFVGGQAGANLQMGSVVLGFEVDGQWANIEDSSAGTVTPPGYTVTTSNRVNRFGTLRPRVGLAWDRTLVYATGGLAWARVNHTLNFADIFGFRAADQVAGTQVGYVVGGGLEHAFTSRLSLKVEYQYINLGTERYVATEQNGGFASGFTMATDTKTDFHTVRLGLNWKFNESRAPSPYK